MVLHCLISSLLYTMKDTPYATLKMQKGSSARLTCPGLGNWYERILTLLLWALTLPIHYLYSYTTAGEISK